MCNNTPDAPQRQCRKCGKTYPLTSEYWPRHKESKGGFERQCKLCAKEQRRKWIKANRDKVKESNRKWQKANPDKMREYRRKWSDANADKARDCSIKWRKNNLKKARASASRWQKNNPEKSRKYTRKWRESNPEKARENTRKWQKDNLDKKRINEQKRRARNNNLPDTLTDQDWHYALDYFHGCCAVCGRQLNDLFGEHIAAMDHWIPLTSDDCPGTTPENIVPLCHGVGGCNNSKGAKDPETWLTETYGTRKARQIMARINTYFQSAITRRA